MARVQNVASLTIGGLALSAVYVLGQRALRKRVEHRFSQEMVELSTRLAAIQHLRGQGGPAAQVAEILDKLEQDGILTLAGAGDLEFTFTERLSLLIRPRVNDRTSLKMLFALQQIMNELAAACDAAGIELGMETESKGRRIRRHK